VDAPTNDQVDRVARQLAEIVDSGRVRRSEFVCIDALRFEPISTWPTPPPDVARWRDVWVEIPPDDKSRPSWSGRLRLLSPAWRRRVRDLDRYLLRLSCVDAIERVLAERQAALDDAAAQIGEHMDVDAADQLGLVHVRHLRYEPDPRARPSDQVDDVA
jgi:hypothetical protein